MPHTVGSVDPLPMLFPFAIVAIPVIYVIGRLIWRASMRRGLWLLGATVALSALIGWWRGPVWIWAVIIGAVLISVWIGDLQPLPDSWWSRHERALAEGRSDWTYQIIPGLIVLASLAPLIALIVASAVPEPELPGASTEGVVQLGPDNPIAVIDVEVAISDGMAGTPAALAFSSGPRISNPDNAYERLMTWAIYPIEEGAVGQPSSSVVGLDTTCSDCAYKFRIAFGLDSSVDDVVTVDYEAIFRWRADPYEDISAEDLPAVTVGAKTADTVPVRLKSLEVLDDTAWTPDHPYDLRRVSVSIDPGLIPETGLQAWPMHAQSASRLTMTGDGDFPPNLGVYHVRPLDPGCTPDTCAAHSYIIPIVARYGSDSPQSIDLTVVHWIDDYDGLDEPRGGIDITIDGPDTWLVAEESSEVTLDSTGSYAVGFDIQFDGIPPEAPGMAVGILTVDAPRGVTISSQAYETDNGRRVISQPFLGCEDAGGCSMGFGVVGGNGDQLNWHLGVYYGFFDLASSPDTASISIGVSTRRG